MEEGSDILWRRLASFSRRRHRMYHSTVRSNRPLPLCRSNSGVITRKTGTFHKLSLFRVVFFVLFFISTALSSPSVLRVFFSRDRSRKNPISCIDNNVLVRRRRKQQNYLPSKPQTINSTAYGFAKSILFCRTTTMHGPNSTQKHNGIFRGKNNNLSIPCDLMCTISSGRLITVPRG